MTLNEYVDELGRRPDVSASVVDDYEAQVEDLTQRLNVAAADLLETRSQRAHLARQLDEMERSAIQHAERHQRIFEEMLRERARLVDERDEARANDAVHTGMLKASRGLVVACKRENVRLRTIITELGAAEAAESQEEIEALRPGESQSGLCEVGKDKVTCVVTDRTHRLIYHSGTAVPAYANCQNAKYPEHGSRSPCAICGWSRP